MIPLFTRPFIALSLAIVAAPLPAIAKVPVPPDAAPFKAALAVPREEMLSAMRAALFPTDIPIPAPNYKITGKEDQSDHERWSIQYDVDEGENVHGWLLVPKPLPAEGERLPLVLALHPTNNTGKDRTIGLFEAPPVDAKDEAKRVNRTYALDLVRRGFVVFVPDRAAYGERRITADLPPRKRMEESQQVLSAKHPGWTLTGKAIWDLERALDFLITLDFVDSERIGSVGHSLGAWDTVIFGAVDDRVRAIAVSHCGSLRYAPALWNDEEALRAYLAKNRTKFVGLNQNLNVYLMLLAPKPQLFFWSIMEPKDQAPSLIEALRIVCTYNIDAASRAGVPYNFSFYMHTGGHDFPSDSRALAWQWFSKQLAPEQRTASPSQKASLKQTKAPSPDETEE